jgi:hypothetical protein
MQNCCVAAASGLLVRLLQVCFGTVTSRGVAGDSDNWGVSAACCPVLHGVTLDLLPLSWREQTDMLQVSRNHNSSDCVCWRYNGQRR